MFTPFTLFIVKKNTHTVDNDLVNIFWSLNHSKKTWEDLEDLQSPVQETVHWMQKQSHRLAVGNCVTIHDLLTFIAYLLTFIV